MFEFLYQRPVGPAGFTGDIHPAGDGAALERYVEYPPAGGGAVRFGEGEADGVARGAVTGADQRDRQPPQAAGAAAVHPRYARIVHGQERRVANHILPAGVERHVRVDAPDQAAPVPRVAEPELPVAVDAVTGRPEIQGEPLDGSRIAGAAVPGPPPLRCNGLEYHGARVGERTQAPGTGLGDHQQPVGGNHVYPAPRPLRRKMLRPVIADKVVPAQGERSEHHQVRRGCRTTAVMPGAGELPGFLQAGDRVRPGLPAAGAEVERPRFGVKCVADHQGPDAVTDFFAPEDAAVFRGQGRYQPVIECSGEELLPEVTVDIDAEEDQYPVAVYGAERTPRETAGGPHQVQRLPPAGPPGRRVQGDDRADRGLLELLLRGTALVVLECFQGRAPRRQCLPALGRRDIRGRQEHRTAADGDRPLRYSRGRVYPAGVPGRRVDGEHGV